MINNSQKTIYGAMRDLCSSNDEPYQPLPNTTLNEKYGVMIDSLLPGEYPVTNIFTIGLGVPILPNTLGIDGYPYHSATDADLYLPTPFLIRSITNDITDIEKSKYRLRVERVVDGVLMVMYYGLVIDLKNTKTVALSTTIGASVRDVKKFNALDASYLNPTPNVGSVIDPNNVNYTTVVTKIPFTLTPEDVREINNCGLILHNDPNLVIRELGLCMSVDRPTDSGYEGSNIQVKYHISVGIEDPIDTTAGDYVRVIEIGSSEPLL